MDFALMANGFWRLKYFIKSLVTGLIRQYVGAHYPIGNWLTMP